MPNDPVPTGRHARHWDAAYASRGADAVSWYQAEPRVSLELIDALGVEPGAAVVDVGGGASFLVDRLVARGFADLTVLDLSQTALDEVRPRLDTPTVRLLHEDVLGWRPDRRYDLWHDRAVLHFLVDEDDHVAYFEALHRAVRAGSFAVIATFAPDGPEMCSGLPVRRYSADELARQLGESFELLETRREIHTTPRGVVQPFTWIAGRFGAEGTG